MLRQRGCEQGAMDRRVHRSGRRRLDTDSFQPPGVHAGPVDACRGGRRRLDTGQFLPLGAGFRRDSNDVVDRGSVTPLVIGMLVCLMLLTAGVTAAGSAFLAGQRLQRLCDGAVAAAVGAVDPRRSSAENTRVADPIAAANRYLHVRGPDVGAVIRLGGDTVSAQCSNEAPITFGFLFGSPTLARTVTSTSQPILRQSALTGFFASRDISSALGGTLI